jgi:chromosome segregation ATPase
MNDDLVTRLRESTVTISEAMRQRKLAAGEIEYLREALAQQRRYYDEMLADRDSLRAELARIRRELTGIGEAMTPRRSRRP